jgi:hypothetical protein
LTLADDWLPGKRQQRIASPLSKDEVRCGQCFRNFEKFRLLRHCLATRCRKATDDPHEVASLAHEADGTVGITDTE